MILRPVSLALALMPPPSPDPAPAEDRVVPEALLCRLPAASTALSSTVQDDFLTSALIATEQAIQLDELIRWVRAQAAIDPNAAAAEE